MGPQEAWGCSQERVCMRCLDWQDVGQAFVDAEASVAAAAAQHAQGASAASHGPCADV